MNKINVKWLAGFWEGEGSFSTHFYEGNWYAIRVGLGQTGDRGKKIITQIHKQFKLGSVIVDMQRKNSFGKRPLYGLQITNAIDCLKFMLIISKYIKFRQKQIIGYLKPFIKHHRQLSKKPNHSLLNHNLVIKLSNKIIKDLKKH